MSISPVMQNAKRQTVLKGADTAGWPGLAELIGFTNLLLSDFGQCACRFIIVLIEINVYIGNIMAYSRILVQWT